MAALSTRRRQALIPLALFVAVIASGCDNGRAPEVPQGDTSALVVSESWVTNNQGAGASDRISSLERAIQSLREETGTGWVGRQDDVTGYLAELKGGSRDGGPAELMDQYGPALFGVDSTALDLGEPDTESVPGMSSWRAVQKLAGVPVLDGVLVMTSRTRDGDEKLTEVRGRVFPELTVSTEPRVGAGRATRIAEQTSGGSAEGTPRLVVLPEGSGVLAWEVLIASVEDTGSEAINATGNYYVDAHSGEVVGIRPVSVELGIPVPTTESSSLAPGKASAGKAGRRAKVGAEPDPNTVEVHGEAPDGRPLNAHGLRAAGSIELTDTTTPAYDSATRRGSIITYDAEGLTDPSGLPGRVVTSPDTTIRDPEAIAAHAYSRAVIDYFEELGRNSWDDEGGTLISSVNYGPADYCNAFFNGRQMVYANPCARAGGETSTYVGIDIAGHEITHGVTATTAGLIYLGQSGALNESFSDYFGNVIGNLLTGEDSVAFAEEVCHGFTTETHSCTKNPDGTISMRYMLNGNDFDDYLRILSPGFRLYVLGLAKQDQGGVHLNSAIWNNALWSIRSRLAQIDGETGNDSPLALAFDRAVYGALATRLGPTAGFVDARAAVEQVIIDSQLDPVVLRVAREVFDANKICTGCPTIGPVAGDSVSTTPQAQLRPTVAGNLVTWLESSTDVYVGSPASSQIGGAAPTFGAAKDAVDVTLAGDAVLVLNAFGGVLRYDSAGGLQRLGAGDFEGMVTRGVAGSAEGGAFAPAANRLSFVDPAGNVTSADVPGLQGDSVISLGTGGGWVAAGTRGGKVYSWQPGGAVTQLGTVRGAVASVAAYGGNVFAVGCTQDPPGRGLPKCSTRLFTADGRAFDVSNNASVFGATMSDEYVVWPEATGALTGGIAESEDIVWPETDLYLLSLATGKIYNLYASAGQQGFPSLSGRRLVWQDSGFGGDDIVTTELPGGL